MRKHKTFFLSIGFLIVFSFSVSHAAGLVSPYNPGETLDPQCAPGETNCTVTTGATSFSMLSNLPTTIAGYGITDAYTKTASDARYAITAGVSGGQSIVGGTGVNDALSLQGTTGNGILTSNALQFKVGNDGATTAMDITNAGNVGIGISGPVGILAIGGNRTASAWGVNGIQSQVRGATYTDSSSSGTIANVAMNSITNSTLASSNLAVYTNASTLYIGNAPTAGTNTTITNPWALTVANGNINLAGNKTFFGSATERIVIESTGNGASLSFNRDPDLGTIYDTNGYAYQFSHTKSVVPTSDKFSLNVFNPSGSTVGTPLTVTAQDFVGIDDSAPTQALDVSGNIKVDGTGHGIYFPDGSFISTNAGGAGVGTTSTTDLNFTADSDNNGSGVINFAVNGNGAMTIANNGFVGINTASPTQSLTVNGNLQIAGMGNGIYFADGSFMGSAANIGTGISAPGDISLVADTDDDGVGAIDLSTSGVQRFVVNNNGNIGIGLSPSSPSTTLQINSTTGNGVVIGPTAYPSYMGTNGLYIVGQLHASTNLIDSGSGINWGASQARISGTNPGANTNSYLSFFTGSVAAQGERMRIIDNGNVGIGTITPDALLSIGSTLVPTATVVADYQNAGGICTLDPSTIGGLSCSSDMNLKKNITNLGDDSTWNFNTNITPANQTILADVLALNPVDYNWNVEADGTPKHAGFIAQEVQEVFPGLVTKDSTTQTLSLDYTGLVPYTIEAIKEMNVTMQSLPTFSDPSFAQNVSTFLTGIGERGEAVVNAVTAHQVTTDQLCVGTACVTQQQFLQMIQNSGSSSSSSNPNAPDSTTVVGDPNTDPSQTESPEVTAPVVSDPIDQTQSPSTDDLTVQ